MTVGVVMTKIVVNKFRKDLVSAGFIVNDEKSVWEPIQRLEWLGFIWDLRQGSIEIPETKQFTFKKQFVFYYTISRTGDGKEDRIDYRSNYFNVVCLGECLPYHE
jgi:hypothetical protein